jgi:hypothetical protein
LIVMILSSVSSVLDDETLRQMPMRPHARPLLRFAIASFMLSACGNDSGHAADAGKSPPALDSGRDAAIDAAIAFECDQGKTFPIIASDYDQSCNVDSDCVGIGEGDGCECRVLCQNAAINVADEARWREDVMQTPVSGTACHCPAATVPCCRDHLCRSDRTLCELPTDDSDAGDEDGPTACVAAGGRCVLGGNPCALVGHQNCNPDRNPGGARCCLDR